MSKCSGCGDKLQLISGNVSVQKKGISVEVIGVENVQGCSKCRTVEKLPTGIEQQINQLIEEKISLGGSPYIKLNLLG
ncbi:hypothetical protein RZN22_18635 [Bacillaceae bacterium S4-13-58]